MTGYHKRKKASLHPFGLTNREWEIMRAVCAGHDSSKRLGLHFGISERTARCHLSTIHSKMKCESTLSCVLKIIATDEARVVCFPHLTTSTEHQLLLARRVIGSMENALPVLNNWADVYQRFTQEMDACTR